LHTGGGDTEGNVGSGDTVANQAREAGFEAFLVKGVDCASHCSKELHRGRRGGRRM